MEKNGFKETLLDYFKTIIITVIITFCILYFVQISRVVGQSMEPTYHEGNILLVDKVFYKRGQPNYDDIVIIHYDVAAKEDMIVKRIVALPGDDISVIDNQLYRNGILIEEDYINEPMDTDDFSYTVPPGKVFVMGDNRNHSIDSRIIGYIDFEEDVIGRVFFKVF